ncbi:MAG TPA: DUF2333 family protein [Spongiibacteraceae bacterium]
MRWRRWSRRAEEWREEAREHVGESTNLRIIAIALVIYFVGVIALGMYWSREPALFQVSASAGSMLHQKIAHPAVGGITTAALLQTVTTLLDKPGGFINNDIAPPGLWLDNISSWERGALSQARDMTVVLRDVFGRSDAGADEDDDLARAAPRLNFSNDSWMLPSSESQYRDAIDYLRAYLTRLQQGDDSAHFVATADNLDRYLAQIARRLDALSQQLSACVKPHENPLLKSSERNLPERATTPAYQIDNIFYEARGSAWALLHLLRAIEIDFADVLRAKNAQTALHQIIADLEATQEPIYSPVILNGSGFGLLANHSLVMASYIARANAAAVNTRALLTQSAPSNSTPPVQD